jgi:excisionase family DNA binding protein
MSPQQLAVTVAEAAGRLQVSRRHAYRLISSGERPSVKIRSLRRVLVRDLVEYLEGLREVSPTTPTQRLQ